LTSGLSGGEINFNSYVYDGQYMLFKRVNSGVAFRQNFNLNGYTFQAADYGNAGSNISFVDAFTITPASNVGIGTTNPATKLEIKNLGSTNNVDRNIVLKLSNAYTTSTALNEPTLTFDNGTTSTTYGGYGWSVGAQVAGTGYFRIGKYEGNPAVHKEYLRIKNDGTVLIGMNGDYANANNYKLAVQGKIICEEVKVALQTNWPDYVFAHNYKLRSLGEVEKYIEANKRLPNMPSAKELEQNEGISVSEMLIKQQEKIEELTLYLIAQNKKLEALEAKVAKKGGK
jgi:hypothetical protein